MSFNHFDARGQAIMVDVSGKDPTLRTAVAEAQVVLRPETLAAIIEGRMTKGDVLVVARLIPQKRVALALEALAALRREHPAIGCTIVGDGPERGRLEALAGRLVPGAPVRFTGALPFTAVLAQILRADLALIPAVGEGFGLVAAEALMAGFPVIACRDGGGPLDVVPEGGGGRITEPTGPAIAAGAGALLAEPAARASARASGEMWRRQLAPATVAGQFRGWYREAASA